VSITVDHGLVTSCRGRWRAQLMVVVPDTQLVEAEATQMIGAGRYEGTEGRVTERNGRRSKTVATKAGDIEIGIPKFRKGSFFPRSWNPAPDRPGATPRQHHDHNELQLPYMSCAVGTCVTN